MERKELHMIRNFYVMSNAIVARLKSGKQVVIGHNAGGWYPMFFIRKEWGNVPSTSHMLDWMRKKVESISIGAYSPGVAPFCYTWLTPAEFEVQVLRGWTVMLGLYDLKYQFDNPNDFGFKQIRVRHYGYGGYKSKVTFTRGLYIDSMRTAWTWMPVQMMYNDADYNMD